MSTVFLAVAVLSALLGVVDFVLIAAALEKRGIQVNMLLARVFALRYLNQYKTVTLRETGRIGPLYYPYIVAMNVALVCGVIGVTLRAL